ncbi:hypothetical protein MBLNU459_g7565t1 [Dothideomycetes sp. NU459]
MLLVHQAGSVKVGEVVRYTLTYTPSSDRILPSPAHLHLKIKNTSAIPLRAAYLHGPYTLHVAAYPSSFNPNVKVEDPRLEGTPDFEPLLKAGGHWTSKLTVPEQIRETGASFAGGARRRRTSQELPGHAEAPKEQPSMTWVIEIASQILFSNSAVVHFELLVGRDERSLDLGFAAVAGHGHGAPGQMHDHQRDREREGSSSHPRGVYSRAVKLVVEDTDALWDKPALPTNDEEMTAGNEKQSSSRKSGESLQKERASAPEQPKKKKKIHLVVLTHGLHSNVGADMLYLKESIDATVKQARLDARKRKAAYEQQESGGSAQSDQTQDNGDEATGHAPATGGQEELQDGDDGEDDEEQVIVRGFSGNSVRTERGIQYLGKRLAKYVLHFTYPDQPFLPVKKSVTRSLTDQFKSQGQKNARDGRPSHHGSSIHQDDARSGELPYTFSSISFIGHSLGGLIQTYAIAYIQKHAPHFFDQIEPINFICMASPLLGLSNENPMYVKFALDFGLVGRTGQDLGLTWRAPTIAKSGWTAMMGGFGSSQKDQKQEDPGAKPLLRILPTGPAHHVLRRFRNRTVYSNVVNDGIVPLRTSCLLFLDWRGLGKVEKARRENGLIGTMVEFGWNELTGANALPKSRNSMNSIAPEQDEAGSGINTPTRNGKGDSVPQPSNEATTDDNKHSTTAAEEIDHRQLLRRADRGSISRSDHGSQRTASLQTGSETDDSSQNAGIIDSFFSFFRPTNPKQSKKVTKAVRRGQTIYTDGEDSQVEELQRKLSKSSRASRPSISRGSTDNPTMRPSKRPQASRGDSILNDPSNVLAPPRTTIFESASDILHPPIPNEAWIIDPSARTRTIFHDRIYHPEDIPPPPVRRPSRLVRSFSSDSTTFSARSRDSESSVESGSMKVEEKIARAYHKDLSWRKVLVRLEPDAHNNMIVRRMFANAYGWPVVKHLCDTHFADTWAATTRDEDEPAVDRAQGVGEQVAETGEEVKGQVERKPPPRNASEMREAKDELVPLETTSTGVERLRLSRDATVDGIGLWDDVYFQGSDDEDDDGDNGYAARVQRFIHHGRGADDSSGTSTIPKQTPEPRRASATFIPGSPATSTDGHRGLGPTTTRNAARPEPQTVLSAENANGEFAPMLTEEPQTVASLNAAAKINDSKGKQNDAVEVGLRKSVEEQMTSSPPRTRDGPDGEAGVAEQVALASSPKPER